MVDRQLIYFIYSNQFGVVYQIKKNETESKYCTYIFLVHFYDTNFSRFQNCVVDLQEIEGVGIIFQ